MEPLSKLRKHARQRTEAMEKENFTYAYSTSEGEEALMNKFEKLCYEFKFEGSPDGGSICKSNIKYFTAGNTEKKQEEIDARKEKSLEMFRAIEAHLLVNPDATWCLLLLHPEGPLSDSLSDFLVFL